MEQYVCVQFYKNGRHFRIDEYDVFTVTVLETRHLYCS